MSVEVTTSVERRVESGPLLALPGTGWNERYMGGSKAAEDRMVEDWARRIAAVQKDFAAKNGRAMRALHAKIVAAPAATFRTLATGEIDRRELFAARFFDGLPAELCAGILAPGKTYEGVIVRFSNASGEVNPDGKKDMRGAAVRIKLAEGRIQDLLMTNMAASFARNPEQQVGVTEAGSNRLTMPFTLLEKFGALEAVRILFTLLKTEPVSSFAAEQFWSRAPFRIGRFALKFKLQPRTPAAAMKVKHTKGFLHDDLRLRLALGSLTYDFCVQFFSNEKDTPIEDGTVEWKTPFVKMGELTLLKQDLDSASLRKVEEEVDRLGFSPANHDGLIGIGSLNRARAAVYATDQRGRGAEVRCPLGFG